MTHRPPRTALPPAFRRLGWSNLLAQFSEQLALAAAPLAAVLLLAASPSDIGWLQTAQTMPFLLLSIPAGLIVDKTSRRALILGSEGLRSLTLAACVLLLLSGGLTLPLLAALGFAGAIGTVCYSVAAPALLPTLVPTARLADANRWLELARSIAYAAGPALGGALVGWIGAPMAYAVATALSVLAVTSLIGLPTAVPSREQAIDQRRAMMSDLREGALFILRHDLLRPVLLTAIAFNTAWFVLQAVFVAYSVQNLRMSATAVGLTLGIYGAGMIAGALATPAIARCVSFGTLVLLGPVGGFVAALVMLLTLWIASPLLAGLSFFLFGAGPILWTIATITLRQAVTPVTMLGRVSAFIMTATFGARPIGAAIGAALASRAGVAACLAVAAAGFLIQLMVIVSSPVPRLRTLPQPAPVCPATVATTA